MKKILVLFAILVLAALLIFGCQRGTNYDYPTGYAVAQQPQNNPYQGGYVGGGCAISGSDNGMPLDVSEPIIAAA